MNLDPSTVQRSFNRAASRYTEHAFLQREVESRLLERLALKGINPTRVIDIGAGDGSGALKLRKLYPKAEIIALDVSFAMCQQAKRRASWWRPHRVVQGNFGALPFADASVDLIYSSLALQWANDLKGSVAEFRRVLKPGGLLMLATLGPDTLSELRAAWAAVDQAPHVHVFIDMHDVGDALLRAGFKDPVMDVERITLTYSNVRLLMRDLKGIGAHNAHANRARGLTGKHKLNGMLAAYEQLRRDNLLPATYEIIYAHATGSSPRAPSQDDDGVVARIAVGAIQRINR